MFRFQRYSADVANESIWQNGVTASLPMSIHKGVSVGRPEAWRQGRGTTEHMPGYPKKGYTNKEALQWFGSWHTCSRVLLSSKFRVRVRAILSSQTFSLRVEEQIEKENLKGQKACRPGPLWIFCYFNFDSLFSFQVYASRRHWSLPLSNSSLMFCPQMTGIRDSQNLF